MRDESKNFRVCAFDIEAYTIDTPPYTSSSDQVSCVSLSICTYPKVVSKAPNVT